MCEACYVLLGQTVFPVHPSLNSTPGTSLTEEKGGRQRREKYGPLLHQKRGVGGTRGLMQISEMVHLRMDLVQYSTAFETRVGRMLKQNRSLRSREKYGFCTCRKSLLAQLADFFANSSISLLRLFFAKSRLHTFKAPSLCSQRILPPALLLLP